MNHAPTMISTTLFFLLSTSVAIAQEEAASSSLIVNQGVKQSAEVEVTEEPHGLRDISMFAVQEAKPPTFQKHDLIQIIVRETSRARSNQKLKAEKEYDLQGQISAWPAFSLRDLLDLRIEAGRTTGLPSMNIGFDTEFEGKGIYERRDDLTARITAEVMEVLPNGNLVLEARSQIKLDDEISTMKVTGICSPDSITPANTVLSHNLHDLKIEKVNEGELKKTNEKGFISKILDAVFAF